MKLEEFVTGNREEFDSEELPAGLWKKVEKDLPLNKKKIRIFNLFSLQQLAAAVTITAVGLAIFLVVENRKLEHTIATKQTNNNGAQVKEPINEIDPEYAKEIDQFTRLIQIKQSELIVLKKDHPTLYSEFMANVKSLNEEYTELQKQLSTAPSKEELMEAMLQNLRLQAELLNEQIKISKQIKQSKNKSNEKATQTV
jgi:hypothetical protein